MSENEDHHKMNLPLVTPKEPIICHIKTDIMSVILKRTYFMSH